MADAVDGREAVVLGIVDAEFDHHALADVASSNTAADGCDPAHDVGALNARKLQGLAATMPG